MAFTSQCREAGTGTFLKPVAKELHPNFWHSKEGQAGKVGTNNKAVRYLTSLISENLRPSEFSSAIL